MTDEKPTIEEQLAALEEVAGAIDFKGALNQQTHTGCWQYRAEGEQFYLPVWEAAALAIRKQQAIDWLTAWCESAGCELESAFDGNIILTGGPRYRVRVMLRVAPNALKPIADVCGPSDAHALAAAIKKLQEQEGE